MNKAQPIIGIVMGSDSDLPVMKAAAEICELLGVSYELTIVSAHRTPERMINYAKTAHQRKLQVIIAGAGGAAHLPGMIASLTHLPVIGVPISSSNSIDGWDSILSILQMPNGVPVATVALNAAQNGGLLALRMLSISDKKLQSKLVDYQKKLEDKVLSTVDEVAKQYLSDF